MELNPEMNNHIAIVLDGVVQQMMMVDDRFAAILLSSPTIVDATGEDGYPTAAHGFIYNEETNSFIAPEHMHDHSEILDD